MPDRLVAAALERFGLSLGRGASATFVRHGENTTYRVTADDGRQFALRIDRPGYQTIEATRSELAWMDSLRASGVRTAPAVPGLDGDPVQTVFLASDLVRTAVMFEWIDGVPLSAVGGLEPWARLGELMAQIHIHGRHWARPDGSRDRPGMPMRSSEMSPAGGRPTPCVSSRRRIVPRSTLAGRRCWRAWRGSAWRAIASG